MASKNRRFPGRIVLTALAASPLLLFLPACAAESAEHLAFDNLSSLEEPFSIDPLDPCGSLLADPLPARAAWFDAPSPLVELTSEIALSWILRYAARIPLEDRASYTLLVERCDTQAHKKTTCTTGSLPLPSAECDASSIRFGLDPTEYRLGTNTYSFALRLLRDGVIATEDAFTMTLIKYPPSR